MIELNIENDVATATLNRAPVNALNPEWVERFDRMLDDVDSGGVRVLRIRSALPVFCAGADLAFLAGHFENREGRTLIVSFVRSLQTLYSRLESMRVVSIAQVNGSAMGGGLELALACDLRAFSYSSRAGLPEVRLGLLPAAGGTQRLPRLVGQALARRMILAGHLLSAREALDWGLCDWVFPDADADAACMEAAVRIASFPGDALAAAKRCLAAAFQPGTNGHSEELANASALLESVTTQEKVRAFLAGTAMRG